MSKTALRAVGWRHPFAPVFQLSTFLSNGSKTPQSPPSARSWLGFGRILQKYASVQTLKKQAGAHFKDKEALVHPSCEADVNASKLWTMVAANSLWLALCLQQPASNLGNLQFLSSNMNILGTNAKNSFYKYWSENRVIFENWWQEIQMRGSSVRGDALTVETVSEKTERDSQAGSHAS